MNLEHINYLIDKWQSITDKMKKIESKKTTVEIYKRHIKELKIARDLVLFGILFGLLWPITLHIFIIFKFLKWLCQQIIKMIENEKEKE